MKKFDNAITQIIFVEYPEGVEVMHLTKVYKNGCLVDYELIYADGTSDEFCEKWNSDFIDCGNLSPITIKASDFKEFENELKGAIKMTTYNTYQEYKNARKEAFDKFSQGKIIYIIAFSEKDFKEGLKKHNVTEKDLISFGNGCFLIKKYKKDYEEYAKQQNDILNKSIAADTKGNGFIKSMFAYELANNEYRYTENLKATLDSLGLSYEQIENNAALKNGLNLALKRYEY